MLNRGSKPVVRCAGGSSPANPPTSRRTGNLNRHGGRVCLPFTAGTFLSFFLRRVRYEAACADKVIE
jgi:hypothetical protein